MNCTFTRWMVKFYCAVIIQLCSPHLGLIGTGQQKSQDVRKQKGGSPGYLKMTSFGEIVCVYVADHQKLSDPPWKYQKNLLLYSWRFSRYSAPIRWLVHGHMTSNNETVSHQMP